MAGTSLKARVYIAVLIMGSPVAKGFLMSSWHLEILCQHQHTTAEEGREAEPASVLL